jgi:hypothetical protein
MTRSRRTRLSSLSYRGQPVRPFPTVDAALDGETFPFHPIFSLGLMRLWQAAGWADAAGALGADAAWWHASAPFVEDALNACAVPAPARRGAPNRAAALDRLDRRAFEAMRATQSRHGECAIPRTVLRQLLAQALEARVHTLYQELLAAANCLDLMPAAGLRDLFGSAAQDRGAVSRWTVALEFVREGHTSAVLRATARDARGLGLGAVAVNVGRDGTAAADDLTATARMLAEWHRRWPAAVAGVQAVSSGGFPAVGGRQRAVVVVGQWVEGARELHLVGRRDGSRFVVVDDFEQGAAALPRVSGGELDEEASHAMWSRIVRLRSRLASFDWTGGLMRAPAIEVNEGDVVASAQMTPVIVAASTPEFSGPIGLWLYEAALASGRDDVRSDGSRIYWNAPERAFAAVREAVRDDSGDDGFRALVRRSGSTPVERAAIALGVAAHDELGRHLVAAMHRLVAEAEAK